ncbi:phosphate signaling complex protein PhoU [Glycomyces albidus]|jgi:phosphate transport system protein|uniref:Phosphate-specific transport system accessory protein PhoU n=1 Tax=Glycomyces albidus TaxID=2656774 RepID=A0A6L5GF43_9ACTN|nr:phosphate signaling complex protein PhoU [Glycomyces albidus]MQM28334.1 phosphate signaling complex protein PhoU [Glycomyces albidus]
MANPFHQHLNELNDLLVDMARRVGAAMEQATAALLEGDTVAAEAVVAGDQEVNALQFKVDDRIIALMTQYDAVASDLRFVLGAVRISVDLERMGDLAKHVAKSVLLRAPVAVIPDSLRLDFAAMGAAAVRISEKLVGILRDHDELQAAQMGLDDDELDAVQDRIHAQLPTLGYGPQTAVDVALLARFYERFGDHAVRVSHQVVYAVTGDVHLDRS